MSDSRAFALDLVSEAELVVEAGVGADGVEVVVVGVGFVVVGAGVVAGEEPGTWGAGS